MMSDGMPMSRHYLRGSALLMGISCSGYQCRNVTKLLQVSLFSLP